MNLKIMYQQEWRLVIVDDSYNLDIIYLRTNITHLTKIKHEPNSNLR